MNDQHKLSTLLKSSFVLGGSPCSGKSTLAERLSAEFQFPYYKVDDHMWRHLELADPQSQPTMAAYGKLSWNEIWSQPVDQQVEHVIAYYTEQFPMILDDLLAYAGQGPIIMEGAAFLPALVHRWGVAENQAVFLVPTKAFQLEFYSQRDWVRPILDTCTDPDQAFANWMERDHRFGQEIIQQAQSLGYPTITVDGIMDIEQTYQWMLEQFHLHSAEG
jgi:2-phosphoglycerate kinase